MLVVIPFTKSIEVNGQILWGWYHPNNHFIHLPWLHGQNTSPNLHLVNHWVCLKSSRFSSISTLGSYGYTHVNANNYTAMQQSHLTFRKRPWKWIHHCLPQKHQRASCSTRNLGVLPVSDIDGLKANLGII